MLHRVICIGIQRSGPIHLETNWDGSSAQRNESLNIVLPRLKSEDWVSVVASQRHPPIYCRQLTVSCQPEVWEEVVRQGLRKIRPVELQSHKHDAGPHHDAEVDLPYHFELFAPCPSRKWVKTMRIFPAHSILG